MSRPGWEDADTCAQMRTRVRQLAASKWQEALKVAAEIPLPWYRVQSLALVAAAAPDEHVDAILTKAVREAAADTDAYRRVAVLAWVIDAAAARHRAGLARKVIGDALRQMGTVVPIKSRASALELLLKRAVAVGARETRQVAEALLDAAAILATDPIKKWKRWGTSYFNRTAQILGNDHRALAEMLLTDRVGAARAEAILARHSAPAR